MVVLKLFAFLMLEHCCNHSHVWSSCVCFDCRYVLVITLTSERTKLLRKREWL